MITIPQQTVLFPELFSKPICISFSKEHLSSDGGAILLKAIDQKLGLTQAIAETIIDHRQPAKVRHEILELTRQRIFSLASGYPDCNDAGRLKRDPVLKLMCDRDPIKGDDLGSQPTLSRFENSVRATQLLQMCGRLANSVLTQQKRRRRGKRKPKKIIIDFDPTCNPTYGYQQLTFFRRYYDSRCYLPVVITISFDKERRKYPIAIVLRPGNAGAMTGTLSILTRLFSRIRNHFPSARLYFRADADFCKPRLLDYLDNEGIRYAIPIASNAVLKRKSAFWMKLIRHKIGLHGKTITLYREDRYQAQSWRLPRRLAFKAEVRVPGDSLWNNDRYIINTLPGNYGPEGIFTFYQQHCDMENTIKEFKIALDMDRTSCSDFLPNQLRVIWSLAAYILMQALQERIVDRELARATMGTLRERLFKIAVRVQESTRRIVFLFTSHHPWADSWLACAKSVGAVPG